MLTVTTLNVNGLRAATRKGFDHWLAHTNADVICLQETRATPEQLPDTIREPDGWHTIHAPAATKGRAGVALYSRTRPDATRIGFGSTTFDTAGRYAEIDLGNLTIASLYLPSGEVGTPRQDEKEHFMDEFLAHLTHAARRATDTGRDLLVCGDWNIAHHEADLKNWKNNTKTAGFLPEERAWLTRVLDQAGYIDVVRTLHPDTDGPYSWWSYRGRAFDNDTGWRIDYHICTPALAKTATTATVERAPSHDTRISDHAPVTVTYER